MALLPTNNLEYKGYIGSVEVSIEDACLHGRILFIDDLVTFEGENVREIQSAFHKAVDRYLTHCERVGKSPNKPYSGTFNVRIGPELHSKAARVAHRKNINLNELVKLAVQAAVDMNGLITHKHRHQHFVNVTIEPGGELRTELASMKTPTWEIPRVKPH